MKTGIAVSVVILLIGIGARAQSNRIGIFTTTTPTPTNDEACYYGALPGQFEVYAVLFEVADVDGKPLAEICGYEFSILLPIAFQVFTTILPSGVVNDGEVPVFDCRGTVPVTDDRALLATLSIATFTGTDGFIYLEPIPTPSIPGSLSICAATEPPTALAATPSSGDLAIPVFGIGWSCGLPEESPSWSTIKALYR